MNVAAAIVTHRRPRFVRSLLGDLPDGLRVFVVRDPWDEEDARSYDEVASYASGRFDLVWVDLEVHHGKRRFGETVSVLNDLCRGSVDYAFFLNDDMRLCERFVERSLEAWSSIEDSKKVALNLLRDKRYETGCWTRMPAQHENRFVDKIGWVDAAFLVPSFYFDKIPRLLEPPRGWRHEGSGIGATISLTLVGSGWSIYGVKRSLVAHREGVSIMHPEREIPITTVDFIDGPERLELLHADRDCDAGEHP